MSYQLLILEEALLDMEDAIEFYDTFQAQQKFSKRLQEGLKVVKENPLILAVKYNNVRIYNLRPYKHQIHQSKFNSAYNLWAIRYAAPLPRPRTVAITLANSWARAACSGEP